MGMDMVRETIDVWLEVSRFISCLRLWMISLLRRDLELDRDRDRGWRWRERKGGEDGFRSGR